jgi:hypothetical protein
MSVTRIILGGIVALLPVMGAAQSVSPEEAALRPLARPVIEADPAILAAINPELRPEARNEFLPRTRWETLPGGPLWTRAAMSALAAHGAGIEEVVPRDIETWCPAYEDNPPELRRAFWVGMMSALAKHESTYRPTAVGGGNLWFGLLQIYPDTARRYD